LHDLAVKGNTHGAQEELGILVRLGSGVKGDMATWDHLGGVPEKIVRKKQVTR